MTQKTTLPAILLVGAGRMGGAMLAGWRELGVGEVVVVDPAGPGLAVPADFQPAAVVLAVKPQVAGAVLPLYARFAGDAVFVSIMAGKTVAYIKSVLGAGAAVVRAMPNTPAAVRKGFTVAVAGDGVAPAQRDLAGLLLSAVGELAWVDDENLLDPVTAVSGGGPAYVFLLTELMEQEAVAQGIPAPLARQMARQTVIGSAALLAASDEDAASLRVAVTSPGGTTEQALAVLRQSNAWPELFAKAIDAATKRSQALSD
jgi:pyrroline-5-carboxylate reductase